MSEKMFNTRIIHKHDTAENWEKATGFIPKSGELIVYDPDENFSYARTKIGDGATPVTELPFTDVQPDWKQTDETAADYIKNKPSEEDALAIVTEMNLVSPVTAEDGSIYTDENGALYSL